MATSGTADDQPESVTVLVVDDDPVAARFVAESLELADPALSAQRETDVEDALATVRAGGIDCVVTEGDLGTEDGIAFLDRLAGTGSDVRAVVHTDSDDPAIAQAAWARGAAYARKDPEVDRYDVLARHILGETEPA